MTPALFLISFTVIYIQVALMRWLEYIYYGTFTSMVIGIALIGFGAGGTLLSFIRKSLHDHTELWQLGFVILTGFGVAAGIFAINTVPLNLAYLFYDFREILKFLFVVVALIPAFAGGGAFIGSVLVLSPQKRGFLYGVNLFGSGLGGIAALAVMYRLPPFKMPLPALIPVAAALFLLKTARSGPLLIARTISGIVCVFVAFTSSDDRVDQYKDLASMRHLVSQSDASFLGASDSPFGRLEAYRSSLFHHIPFTGLEGVTAPPEQIAIYRDGDLIGAPFILHGPAEEYQAGASVLDTSVSTTAYDLIEPTRVLVAGDAGLTGLRSALRAGSQQVTLLLPDEDLEVFLRDTLRPYTEDLFSHPNVTVVTSDYRRYLSEHSGTFNLIHVAAAESFAAASAGYYASREDYVLTVEGMDAALNALADGGLVTVTRGIQTPPRDNPKLFALFYDALKRRNVSDPGNHLLQARGYLALVTLAARNPLDGDDIENFRQACRLRSLDIEYEPGIGEAPSGFYRFSVPGPRGSGDSWYRFAARSIAAGEGRDFFHAWMFDIRPPTDDRPFFHSFFRWRGVREIAGHYGRYWFRKTDFSSVLLAVTLIVVLLVSFLLILLPQFAGNAHFSSGFPAYFFFIGVGYFFIEIVMMRRTSLYLGHPHVSVPVVLSTILTFSGAGSVIQQKLNWNLRRKTLVAFAAVTLSCAALLVPTGFILKATTFLSGFGNAPPFTFIIVLTGIPAFFMGWFFAPALEQLDKIDPSAVPAAWAVNGFASVIASPAAVLIAMNLGYLVTAGLAVFLYGCAVLVGVGDSAGI